MDEVVNFTELTSGKATADETVQYIVHEIVFTIFCVVGICSDATLAYVIFHFRKIHTVPNIFLANWAIADLCSLIVTPSSYRITSVIENVSIPQEFICFLFHTDLIFHSTAMVFMIVLSVDWGIGTYFKKASENFRNYYKYTIGSVWIFALLLCSISTRLCLKRVYHFIPGFLLLFCYCALFLIVLALQICRLVKAFGKTRPDCSTLMLTLATVFSLNWFVGLVNFLFFEMGGSGYLWFVAMLAQCVIFATSLINLTLMYRMDGDFQECVHRMLRRSESGHVDETVDPAGRSVNSVRYQSATDEEPRENV